MIPRERSPRNLIDAFYPSRFPTLHRVSSSFCISSPFIFFLPPFQWYLQYYASHPRLFSRKPNHEQSTPRNLLLPYFTNAPRLLLPLYASTHFCCCPEFAYSACFLTAFLLPLHDYTSTGSLFLAFQLHLLILLASVPLLLDAPSSASSFMYL